MPSSTARKARRGQQFGRPPASPPKPAAPTTTTATSAPAIPSPSPSASASRSASPAPHRAPPAKAKAPNRFILFVGNLPFSATTAGVKAHFAVVRPTGVRHATDRATGRSRGFAFLEFDEVRRMEECLGRFHRSMFYEEKEGGDEAHGEGEKGEDGEETNGDGEDGPGDTKGKTEWKDGRKGWRKINVELTAGGGGKSDTRKKRLQDKNEKLEKERARRKVKKAVVRKELEDREEKAARREDDESGPRGEEPGMHPSRRARFSGKPGRGGKGKG